MPPQGISGIAAVLEKEKIPVRILDLNFEQRRGKDWRRALVYALRKSPPDMVGITSTTPAVLNVLFIAETVKEMDAGIPVVVGGPHPSAMPDNLLHMAPQVDVTVRGEGERTVPELFRAFASRGDLSGVRGIAFRSDGGIVVTEDRPVIEALDELPVPARHLLPPLHEYYFAGHCYDRLPVTSVMTSRGCPQACRFCTQAVFGRRYRVRSPESIVAELELLAGNYGIRSVMFVDETFTCEKKRVYDLCRLLRRKRKKISWLCYAGVNEVEKDLLREMKSAGCFQVYYGMESAVQRILDLMNKKISVESIRRAVKETKDAGLQVRGQFMFNYFTETGEDIIKTALFARDLKLDYAEFSVFFPLPGSDVFEDLAAKKKIRLSEKDDFFIFQQGTSLFLDPIIPLGEVGIDDLRGLVKKAYRDFYLRAGYMLARAGKIRSLQDVRRNLEGFRAFTSGFNRFFKG
jgi:radical SAM superfamily enzyme YgiQ (UPF0313 family)